MLSFLQGKLTEAHPQYIIVQVGGLGLKIFIPASFYFNLPHSGAEILVYTVLLLKKDDTVILYGFPGRQERDFFKMLLGVSGIGPKIALALLGHLTLPRLLGALEKGDLKVLTTVPGIGDKTAGRLVYELKEKIAPFMTEDRPDLPTGDEDPWLTAEEALLGLGYSPREVGRARNMLGEMDGSVEDLFKQALSLLAGND